MTQKRIYVDAKAEKRRIRREILAVRDALSEAAQGRASCLITERLLGHQWFYCAKNLLCYVSYGGELDTRELIREALRLENRSMFPGCCRIMRWTFSNWFSGRAAARLSRNTGAARKCSGLWGIKGVRGISGCGRKTGWSSGMWGCGAGTDADARRGF